MFADYSFLEDAIDLHIHVGPDYIPRYSDSIELAREAAEAKMKAIIIKRHLSSTVAAAYDASKIVDGVKVFGGIALNEPNGEFNVRNVVAEIRSGAKMIWLPTVDAEYAIQKAEQGHWIGHYVNTSTFGYQRKGLSIFQEDRETLRDEVQEILRLCKENDVILGSGHISPQETLALALESKKIGYKKLEVTHPNAWLDDYNYDLLEKLVNCEATITLSFGVCSPHNGRQDPHEIVDVIKKIGAENCCLITDYGQTVHPSPVEGYRVYCQLLMGLGVTKDEIEVMTKENPAKLLSL